uniref:hypothetical protein n=1 Tax=Agathobacter sp. TaxID=2021311 RepID=UPI0040561662
MKKMDETAFESPLEYTMGAGHYYNSEKVTITEGGLFYCSNHLLRFLNFEDFKKYILCSKAACLHNSDSCSAWYEMYDDIQCMAVHNERMYAFFKNKDKNTYDLTEMSLTATERKVIVSLPIGEFETGEWSIAGIGESYYCGNMLWADIVRQYVFDDGVAVEINQCIGINLETGEQTVFGEEELHYRNSNWKYWGIGEDKVILVEQKYAEEPLYPEEFFTAYEQSPESFILGPYSVYKEEEIAKHTRYYAYLLYASQIYDFYIYDVKTGEMKFWMQEEPYERYDEFGAAALRTTTYHFEGWEDEDTIIVCDYTKGIDGELIYLVDLNSYEWTLLFSINDGGIIGNEKGHFMEDIPYLEYIDEETTHIYRFNKETNETEFLFADKRGGSLFILGETSKYYIGYLNDALSVIEKEDYYAGRLDEAKLAMLY